jgi:glycosyltransferase involved in cell wall biosynthesis
VARRGGRSLRLQYACAALTATDSERGGVRVTLAHDYLLVLRGAERTFAAMADAYPGAPIATLLYDEHGTGRRFAGHPVTTSLLQRLGARQSDFRRLLPLYPPAAELLRAPGADVLLSSSSAFAHGIHAPASAVHVCYCHAPFRYVWNERDRALREVPAALRPLLRSLLWAMRRWDRRASSRVDFYIANSGVTQERIRRFYGRDSTVIHPPVETTRFTPGEPGGELLVVSELVNHKRVHVALEAARRAGVPIQVVGSGPDERALREAFPEAGFLGRASDEELASLYAGALAVVVPGIEEFGITAVEAQAAGRPVIAAAAGGALETVLDGETGLLARPDDAGSFAAAIRRIERLPFLPARAAEHAAGFSVARFRERIAAFVHEALERSRS